LGASEPYDPALDLLENKQRGRGISSERGQVRVTGSQQILNVSRRTVASPNPNNLWRRPKEKRSMVEVSVLANDYELVLGSMVPDASIISGFQPHAANMHRGDAKIGKTVAESVGEILIEQQVHFVPVAISRRSRSAANAKHALMSSRVRSGKSRRTSSSDMPDAR